MKSEKQVDQVSLSGVGPRSGRIPREQRDTGIKDHAVVEYPRKFPRSQQTKLWQTTALAQVQRLRRSRVLHSSAGVTRHAKSL